MIVSRLQCGIHYVLAVYTRRHPIGYQLSETEYLNFALFNQTSLTFIRFVIITLQYIRVLRFSVTVFVLQFTFGTLQQLCIYTDIQYIGL